MGQPHPTRRNKEREVVATKRRFATNPRNLLLATASAMALSIGTAEANAIHVDTYTSPSNPFFFAGGEKKVWFDTSGCDDCGNAILTALGGPDFGFRIEFLTPTTESVQTSVSGNASAFGFEDRLLGINVMTNDPLMRIVGVTLAAEAGVIASYDYDANGETDSGNPDAGSADASGGIDLDLFDGIVLADLNDIFDDDVGADDLLFDDDDDSTDTTGIGGPVMGSLSPAVMQTMALRWSLAAGAACDIRGLGLATCDAEASAFINYVDIRFKQTRVPEPGTIGLLGAGLAGLSWMFRRRRRPPGG